MPYYCTVPQCTSMAGKAKNVSFHQFPRDEELARLWNLILKRGKPYTKYSKVCSLHFRSEDYTITSVGKNKGQWRTLRKDAIPSRNLPSETPPPTNHHRRNSGAWLAGASPAPPTIDPRIQQQMAQAIYMQTMLAMQARQSDNVSPQHSGTTDQQTRFTLSDIEQLLHQRETTIDYKSTLMDHKSTVNEHKSYKCGECSKCFKDPDVFVLHKRTHVSKNRENDTHINDREENDINIRNGYNDRDENDSNDETDRRDNERSSVGVNNSDSNRQETLRANPILANLLRSGVEGGNGFDVNNILSIENQIMTALAANMESYIKNLTTLLTEAQMKKENGGQDADDDEMTCQSDKQSDLNDDRENNDENCHNNDKNCLHNDENYRSDDEESVNLDEKEMKRSDQSKTNKNLDAKSKVIKKTRRKPAAIRRINSIDTKNISITHVEFDKDLKAKNLATTEDNPESFDSTQNGVHSKLEVESKTEHEVSENSKNVNNSDKNYVTVKNEYDNEKIDIDEPELMTLSDIETSPVKSKRQEKFPDLLMSPFANKLGEQENNIENLKENHDNCLNNKKVHNAQLSSQDDDQNSSQNRNLAPENRSTNIYSNKSSKTEAHLKIELQFPTAELNSKRENNLKTEQISLTPNKILAKQEQSNIFSNEEVDSISNNDQKSIRTDENDVKSPKFDDKSVQTEGKCDEIEESLYPVPTCDTQDLLLSKDSKIVLENSF